MASEASSEYKPLSAPPADGQLVEHNGKQYVTIKEGLAYILVPRPALDAARQSNDKEGVQQVFYNPIQQFNRDLTVLAIKAYGRERLEEKEATFKRKVSSFADKKRKRQGQKTDQDRPAKTQKLSDGAPTAEPAAGEEGAARQAEKAESVPADSAPLNDGEPSAAAGNDAKDTTTSNGAQAVTKQEKPKTKTPFKILDALSATGLRALRYAAEIPFVTSVTSNDLLADAVESIKVNVEHNKPKCVIDVSHDDAIAHMYTLVAQELRRANMQRHHHSTKSDKYDVVDLDPYGSATPFLDAAVQAVRDDGGLLCVTCTDSGVWASNGYPEKAYSLYGGIPLKGGQHSHEVGLRLILHAIETSAAKYGLAMEPLLSLSIDFYIRVFVRIKKSPASVKFQAGKNMIAYNCDNGCGAWTTQFLAKNRASPNKKGSGTFYKHVIASGPPSDKNCEHCGSLMHITGPMYGGRLHSPNFIQRVLTEVSEAPKDVYSTTSRLVGMLHTACEEHLPTEEEAELQETLEKIETESKEKKEGTEDELRDIEKRKTSALAALKLYEQAAVEPYPFYFLPAYIAGRMHCITPPENALRGALVGLGYRVTRSHCKPGSIKTDAPWKVIWHVMREWVRVREPVVEENIKSSSPAYRLLRLDRKGKQDAANGSEAEKAPATEAGEKSEAVEKASKDAEVDEVDKLEVSFDTQLGKDQDKRKYVRYQQNPRENWGPMGRATGK